MYGDVFLDVTSSSPIESLDSSLLKPLGFKPGVMLEEKMAVLEDSVALTAIASSLPFSLLPKPPPL